MSNAMLVRVNVLLSVNDKNKLKRLAHSVHLPCALYGGYQLAQMLNKKPKPKVAFQSSSTEAMAREAGMGRGNDQSPIQ